MDRKPYNAEAQPLRTEWVDLSRGSLLVRELTAGEYAGMKEQVARPPIDPRGGDSPSAVVLQQLVISCYDSDELTAQRTFPDIVAAARVPFEDFQQIMAAISRVNGLHSTEQEILRDFMRATEAPINS